MHACKASVDTARAVIILINAQVALPDEISYLSLRGALVQVLRIALFGSRFSDPTERNVWLCTRRVFLYTRVVLVGKW